MVVAGVMLSYVSALTVLPRPTDALCLAFPWILGVSFILVYGYGQQADNETEEINSYFSAAFL